MTENKIDWKNVATGEQKKQLIDDAVGALETLVDSKESKDILKNIEISTKGGCRERDDHSETLYLTQSGLSEERKCHGHNGDADNAAWYCENFTGTRVVAKEEFGAIVEKYKLTPAKILQVQDKLR